MHMFGIPTEEISREAREDFKREEAKHSRLQVKENNRERRNKLGIRDGTQGKGGIMRRDN